jgi:cation transport regulator ChaC
MPLHFAYGSNMDRAAFVRRCPQARFLGRARLARHCVALMTDGFATVIRDSAAMAHGVLWELNFADLKALDRYEGAAYAKFGLPVLREGGAPVQALIYIGRQSGFSGRAPDDYMAKIVAAAVDHGFPADYVDFLRSLAGETPSPPKFRAIKNPSLL